MNTSPTRFVAYMRVSTQQQGASGLGLDAQRADIAAHVARCGGQIVGEFVEIETGKGANALEKRPELRKALALAKAKRATLVIAKLDRLARNVAFVAGLIESQVDFVAVDMPQANKVMIQMHAVMGEWERDQISARTKAALAVAKARGVRLGAKGAENIAAVNAERKGEAQERAEALRGALEGMKARKLTLRAVAGELAALGHATASGKPYSAAQVSRLLARVA
jgi:DNA invertase Pin-like site-specific DNA recombinase